jgi:hypothetical protein
MALKDYIESDDAVISRTDAASLLKCDPRTISRGMAEGSIPFISLGRRKLIPLQPFLRLLGAESGAK